MAKNGRCRVPVCPAVETDNAPVKAAVIAAVVKTVDPAAVAADIAAACRRACAGTDGRARIKKTTPKVVVFV